MSQGPEPFDPYGASPPPTVTPAPARPQRPRRGGRSAAVVGLLALVSAFVLFAAGYLALTSLRLISIDPVAPAIGWIVLFALASVAAFVVFLGAIVVLIRARPRLPAGLALLAAVLLPALATAAAVSVGVPAAVHNAALTLATERADTVRTAEAVLDAMDVGPGPLRDALHALAGEG